MHLFTPEQHHAENKPDSPDPAQLRQMALWRWDTEGGAVPLGPQEGSANCDVTTDIPPLTNAELAQLRVRVVALENLVIALLAEGSERQLDLVREMAAYISPRPGFTHHPLTVHAAAQMVHLAERAGHFRTMPPVAKESV